MLAVEEVLSELNGEEVNEQGLPPGFRFHPTDEELITFYLASKVFNWTLCGIEIAELDLNRCEPWELPDVAKMGEKEWYFFSLRDRKYPTGLRTNRATGAGYWKATGKDREVCSSATNGGLIGMKKTLVFYRGRAPRGEKTKWVMHEYRLDGDLSYRHTCKEEWVICRIFHKAGEKKNGILQGQSYVFEACSSPTGSLPQLLETQTALLECQESENPDFQNAFVYQHHQQESDLKSLIINPVVSQSHSHSDDLFPMNGFQTSFSHNNPSTTIAQSPSSMLFKSLLLSHQDLTLKEQNAIPRQCKTEASFSHFQLPDANNSFSWMEKIQPNTYQNPLFFEMGCNLSGLTTTQSGNTAGSSANEMSTSVAFNRSSFRGMLDSSIRLPGESWALDA